MSWRNSTPIHPTADLFPLVGEDELVTLGQSIVKNGLVSPIAITLVKNMPQLCDGRNRLDAMERVGLRVALERSSTGAWKVFAQEQLDDGRWVGKSITGPAGTTVTVITGDPTEYIIAVNINRRHLTPEIKRELIAALLKEHPERSDRAIGEMVKADHKTVAVVRRKEEDVGSIPHVDKRVDTKGRKQPTTKAKPTTRPKVEPMVEPKVIVSEVEPKVVETQSVPEVVTAPPTAPEQPASPGPDHAELSLDDIVQIVSDQVAAGKVSRNALGSAIFKLQQIKRTIPVQKRTDPGGRGNRDARDRAKAVWRQDPSLTKRAVEGLAKCGSKAALEARRELEAAGEIAPKKAKRADKAKGMPNPFITIWQAG